MCSCRGLHHLQMNLEEITSVLWLELLSRVVFSFKIKEKYRYRAQSFSLKMYRYRRRCSHDTALVWILFLDLHTNMAACFLGQGSASAGGYLTWTPLHKPLIFITEERRWNNEFYEPVRMLMSEVNGADVLKQNRERGRRLPASGEDTFISSRWNKETMIYCTTPPWDVKNL